MWKRYVRYAIGWMVLLPTMTWKFIHVGEKDLPVQTQW
jgi:hypothetical protein